MDVEDGCSGGKIPDDCDFSLFLSRPPAPPPLQKARKKRLSGGKPKEIPVTATTKASSIGKIPIVNASLKNQDDTHGEKRVYENQPPTTEVKDVKNIKATRREGNREINVAEVSEHCSVESIFADLPKMGETKEIKMSHSVAFSKEETTQKHGEISGNEKQNQTRKQHQNEDLLPDEDDTMEATWRVINGGIKPKEKQLKKCETWPQPKKFVLPEEEEEEEEESEEKTARSSGGTLLMKELRKSMTFNDTVTIRCRGGLRRDPSMNLEEFNQRVESFISKFNHEMRLQRQESEQRYLDMIRQGL